MPNNAIVSIDPGVSSGIAALTVSPAPKLLAYALFNFAKPRRDQALTATRHIWDLFQALRAEGVEIVAAVIEDQYVAKNPASTISLARCSGRWMEAIASCADEQLQRQIPIDFVAASHWQRMEIHGATRGRRQSRTELKRMSRIIVEQAFGVKVPIDAADAILLGRYSATRFFRKGV